VKNRGYLSSVLAIDYFNFSAVKVVIQLLTKCLQEFMRIYFLFSFPHHFVHHFIQKKVINVIKNDAKDWKIIENNAEA